MMMGSRTAGDRPRPLFAVCGSSTEQVFYGRSGARLGSFASGDISDSTDPDEAQDGQCCVLPRAGRTPPANGVLRTARSGCDRMPKSSAVRPPTAKPRAT